MTALNLTPASERSVEYILAAVQCYAEEWKTMTMSSRNRDANHERCKATLARIRTMLEDDASKIERAALAQSPVSAEIDLPPSIIARTEDIRLAHANPTGRPRSHLVRDVEALLAHIVLLSSAAPVSSEGLERDAARYRWLRDKSEPGICAFYLSVGKAFHEVKFKPETVDDAIDAQIAAADKETS